MNGWLHGWMTNLSLKTKACVHAYYSDNEQTEKGKITLKKKTCQTKKNYH